MPLPPKQFFTSQSESVNELEQILQQLRMKKSEVDRSGISTQTALDRMRDKKEKAAIAASTLAVGDANASTGESGLRSYLNTILSKANDSVTMGLDDALWGATNVLGNAGRGNFNISDNFTRGREDAYSRKQQAFEQNPTLKSYMDAGEMGLAAGGMAQLGKMGVNALRNRPQPQAQPQAQPKPQAQPIQDMRPQPIQQSEMGWRKPGVSIFDEPVQYGEQVGRFDGTMSPGSYIQQGKGKRDATNNFDLMTLASRRNQNPKDVPFTDPALLKEASASIRGQPISLALGRKPDQNYPYTLVSRSQRQKVFNDLEEPLLQDTMLTRQQGYMKNDSVTQGDDFTSNFVVNPDDLSSIDNLLKSEFTSGRGTPMIARAPKGTPYVDKRGTGINNELLMQENISRRLKDRMPLAEWLKLAEKGQRPFAQTGGIVGLMELLRREQENNEI